MLALLLTVSTGAKAIEVVTDETTTLSDGVTYWVASDVTISSRITVSGSATLVLRDGYTLTAKGGIELSEGNQLTINGDAKNSGTLVTNGESTKAGIGAYKCGNLTINGGIINATGGDDAAGIGGSMNSLSSGTITINGGIINATGGNRGAGIGGGSGSKWSGAYGQCGTIIINGGQVTATGVNRGAGIGPGYDDDGNDISSGSLTIGWTKATDFIKASSLSNIYGRTFGSITLADAFVDDDGTVHTNTAQGTLDGKTLRPAVGLKDDADNTDVLIKADGLTLPTVLSGRTLYKDGSWNTLCLPFDLSLSGSVLDGATAKTLTSTAYDSETKTLTLTFGEAVSTLEAGKPYIIKWESAASGNIVDLSTLTSDYEAQNGDVLTGTLGGNYKITIADGATLTLSGATINGVNDENYKWAGITCEGDATIVLSGENSVKGFHENYSGIYIAEGCTLTIQGDGSLDASSNGTGAGIGGGYYINCGNIVITGGTISATSGKLSAGIGGGMYGSCGNISITGGTITATGGADAAGIGSGVAGSCGDITITDGVTSVTAIKGDGATNSIGAGYKGSCGTVTIGGTEGAISESPYTYTGNGDNLVSPVFEGVTISGTTANVSTTYVDFVGCFSPVSISGEDKTMLYLGADNTLYYPNAAMQIGSCRAYFTLNGITAGEPGTAGVRAFVLNFGDGETTAITATSVTNPTNAAAWYTLDGRRLAGKPAVRGIYVNNGRKVFIK